MSELRPHCGWNSGAPVVCQWDDRRVTEKEEAAYAERLDKIFGDIMIWQSKASDGTLHGTPHPRSRIVKYDEKTSPLQLSHAVQGLLNAAIEHQHAVAALIKGAGVLHSGAPFTVTRPSIINCSDARRDATPAWERIF